MNTVEANNEMLLGADENAVLQYLKKFPSGFVSEMEISRHADGRTHFTKDKHWSRIALTNLLDLHLVDTDGLGHYKFHSSDSKRLGFVRKFLSPRIREVLEKSGHNLDLSAFI
jgi:hypothetical protein